MGGSQSVDTSVNLTSEPNACEVESVTETNGTVTEEIKCYIGNKCQQNSDCFGYFGQQTDSQWS